MTRALGLFSILSLSLSVLAACEGAEARPAPTTAQKANAETGTAADHDMCVAFLTHARTCTDQYIPALVDQRAQLDRPAGIKAKVARDRDGMIAQAKQEWASDSSPENIEKMCSSPKLAAAATDEKRQAVTACNANTDCIAYSQCAVAIFADHL